MRPDLVDSAALALDRLRATAKRGQPYDLAVLDMFMPVMDGLQLAQAISADPLLKGTPMIMLTSSMQLEPAVLREAGIGQWLTKPMRSSELYDRLMRLMAATEADVHVERPTADRSQPVGDHGSLGKILVVEDNSLNQLVAEGLLSRLGYEALSVVNGVEALDAVESFDYSAILMDCHMPVMDGFTATEEIRRRQSNGSRIPIIAMTAGALAEDRERCLAVGMDDYISKPVDLQALETVLSRWVEIGPPSHNGASTNGSGHSTPRQVDERPPIDESRLEGLRDLEAPDGSSILTSILAAFTGHSADLLVTLREAAQGGDNKRLHSVAHELRGAAATAGATHVAELCSEIELTARRGGPGPSAELLDQLEDRIRAGQECPGEHGVLDVIEWAVVVIISTTSVNGELPILKATGTGGTALAAFHSALVGVNLGHYNLVRLSSVLPPGTFVDATGTAPSPVGTWGDRLYCVYAEQRTTTPGEEAWAGIGWVQRLSGDGGGLMVEHEGGSEAFVTDSILTSLRDMVQGSEEQFSAPDFVRQWCPLHRPARVFAGHRTVRNRVLAHRGRQPSQHQPLRRFTPKEGPRSSPGLVVEPLVSRAPAESEGIITTL